MLETNMTYTLNETDDDKEEDTIEEIDMNGGD